MTGGVEKVGAWRVEDEGRDGGIRDGQVGCQRGSDTGSVGDDVLRCDGARSW